MEHDDVAWSGRTWRMPPWLWLSVAAMVAGTLHILLDASVGLFPARGRLAPAVAAALLLISLIHAWWAISLAAGARGVGGGVASAAILGLGWTLLTNGSAIAYCPPRCPQGAPLTDVAHVGEHGHSVSAERGFGLPEVGLPARADGHGGALGGQAKGNLPSDTLAGRRDHGALAGEMQIHRLSSLVHRVYFVP